MHRCARLAATTCLLAKCQDAFVDPVLGTTRQPTGSIKPASQPTHPAVSHLPAQRIRNGFRRPSGYGKALPGDRLGQLRDARRSVAQQMHRYDIPKFDPPQLHRVVHHLTVACGSDSARSRTHLSLRGGHIGTGNSAVTDVTTARYLAGDHQWRISRCNPHSRGISLPLLT